MICLAPGLEFLMNFSAFVEFLGKVMPQGKQARVQPPWPRGALYFGLFAAAPRCARNPCPFLVPSGTQNVVGCAQRPTLTTPSAPHADHPHGTGHKMLRFLLAVNAAFVVPTWRKSTAFVVGVSGALFPNCSGDTRRELPRRTLCSLAHSLGTRPLRVLLRVLLGMKKHLF